MQIAESDLDRMQAAYKATVEKWIEAIREEEALASVDHTVAEVDRWEAAHFREDEIRNKVKATKKNTKTHSVVSSSISDIAKKCPCADAVID